MTTRPSRLSEAADPGRGGLFGALRRTVRLKSAGAVCGQRVGNTTPGNSRKREAAKRGENRPPEWKARTAANSRKPPAAMVRKGSSVRVRLRACLLSRWSGPLGAGASRATSPKEIQTISACDVLRYLLRWRGIRRLRVTRRLAVLPAASRVAICTRVASLPLRASAATPAASADRQRAALPSPQAQAASIRGRALRAPDGPGTSSPW